MFAQSTADNKTGLAKYRTQNIKGRRQHFQARVARFGQRSCRAGAALAPPDMAQRALEGPPRVRREPERCEGLPDRGRVLRIVIDELDPCSFAERLLSLINAAESHERWGRGRWAHTKASRDRERSEGVPYIMATGKR